MNEDDGFMKKMTGDWQQQKDDVLSDPQEVRRLLAKNRLARIGELLGALVALAAAVLFWQLEDLLIFEISAFVMLLTSIVIVVSSAVLRKPVMQWGDWSVAGLLEYRIRHCQLEIRNFTAGIYSCVFLLLFAVFIWFVDYLGEIPLPVEQKVISSAIMAVVAVVVILALVVKRAEQKEKLRKLQSVYRQYENSEEL